MDPTGEQLLNTWNANTAIVNNIASLIDDSIFDVSPAPGEFSAGYHLCHMHGVRMGWLSEVSPEAAVGIDPILERWDSPPVRDLPRVRAALAASGEAVGKATRDLLESGATETGPYKNPVFFLQHMLWHDGWHCGLLMLCLRLAGREPGEEWEEPNVWSFWRTE
jgi:uncharacterized damage-inducible protein DinB